MKHVRREKQHFGVRSSQEESGLLFVILAHKYGLFRKIVYGTPEIM